jgi:hypothetical protein
MTKNELIDWVSKNNISKTSWLVFNLLDEENNEKQQKGKFEFTINGGLAINDETVGVRIQVVKGSYDTMPLAGGMKLSLIQSIELEN